MIYHRRQLHLECKAALIAIMVLWSTMLTAQTIPVGSPLEEFGRRMQLYGKGDLDVSYTIRPIFSSKDSLHALLPSQFGKDHAVFPFFRKAGQLKLLPVTIRQQYNTHHPYGWNDGPMIGARGYQNYFSAGFHAQLGMLSIQFQPELVYAENKDFQSFPSDMSDSVWKSYYYVLNRIDAPERFGNRHYFRVFPGQSGVSLNYRKLSLGISTGNLWWGPGRRNSLIMSNNAPGFLHASFRSKAPVITPVGSFEWQVISGLLENSGYLPLDTTKTFQGQPLYRPKTDDRRYINGMILTWQPKWTKGLFLGFQRAYYQYLSMVPSSFDGFMPVFSKFFKKNLPDEDRMGRDQLLSVFMRMALPESGAELYAEYGRNDHAENLLDLALEPDHASAYILGLRKIFPSGKKKDVGFFMELTHLQNSQTRDLRALEGWYTHYQVRHGYTQLGQVIGAGIGPGGNSQTMGLELIDGFNKSQLTLERVVHDNDFYYDAFQPRQDFGSHWVDLSVNLNRSWASEHFLYTADLTWVRSLNYEWQKRVNKNNLWMNFSLSYLF